MARGWYGPGPTTTTEATSSTLGAPLSTDLGTTEATTSFPNTTEVGSGAIMTESGHTLTPLPRTNNSLDLTALDDTGAVGTDSHQEARENLAQPIDRRKDDSELGTRMKPINNSATAGDPADVEEIPIVVVVNEEGEAGGADGGAAAAAVPAEDERGAVMVDGQPPPKAPPRHHRVPSLNDSRPLTAGYYEAAMNR